MITITGFDWVPDFAKGLVRDLRPRWALEEAGLPYGVKLISLEEKGTAAYRALQPFSQVPVLQEGELTLFESGAMVLYIARDSNTLLPNDDVGRARATAWVFAALNSVEPSVTGLIDAEYFNKDALGAKENADRWRAKVETRLSDLAERLGDRMWLEDRFTVGDLMIATTLRFLRHTQLVADHPVLGPYLARCEARPAFQKALADQLASFKEAA
jgi:glutathione S-transferase